jgi:hypothetical protein
MIWETGEAEEWIDKEKELYQNFGLKPRPFRTALC